MPSLADLLVQVSDVFKYNIQILPDTLFAATLLFALLFQSAPLATLGAGLIVNAGVHPLIAGFMSRNISGLARPIDSGKCGGRFPGLSFTGAAALANGNNDITRAEWPSYYSSFIGFFLAYILSLTFIYREELNSSPTRKTSTNTGLIIAVLLLVLVAIYRISSGCDDILGLVVGLLIGAVLGVAYITLVARASDRVLTNMLALPLFKNVAVDGKPIYVCA